MVRRVSTIWRSNSVLSKSYRASPTGKWFHPSLRFSRHLATLVKRGVVSDARPLLSPDSILPLHHAVYFWQYYISARPRSRDIRVIPHPGPGPGPDHVTSESPPGPDPSHVTTPGRPEEARDSSDRHISPPLGPARPKLTPTPRHVGHRISRKGGKEHSNPHHGSVFGDDICSSPL